MARATHILNVPIIGQRTSKECGNTVLTSVLQYFGKHYNVAEVAELANTQKTGTDHGDLVTGARAAGATVFAKSGGGSKALREITDFVSRGLPVICGWWSMSAGKKFGEVGVDYDKNWTLKERIARDSGHYFVLRGYTPDTLLFMDPQDDYNGDTRGYVEYSDDEFLRVWYDTDGDEFDMVKNWYMVINYEGRKFAAALGGGEDFIPGVKKAAKADQAEVDGPAAEKPAKAKKTEKTAKAPKAEKPSKAEKPAKAKKGKQAASEAAPEASVERAETEKPAKPKAGRAAKSAKKAARTPK